MKVLVTGGTSGLGLAMASALSGSGATVALTSRSGERASAVPAELPDAVGIELDVRDESSVATAVDQAWSQLGGIDMLVNNAGIGMRTVNPRFMTQPLRFWEVPVDGLRAAADAEGERMHDRIHAGQALHRPRRRSRARSSSCAAAAVSSMRLVRVSSRLARAIQARSARRA